MPHFIWKIFSPVKLQQSNIKTVMGGNKLSVPENKQVGVLRKEAFQQLKSVSIVSKLC